MIDMSPRRKAAPPNTSGVEDSAIVFVTQILFIFMSLGTQSMLAWMLAPEGRGAYAVCIVFGTIFGVIFTFGTDRAAQYFVMAERLTLSEGVWVSIIIAFVGSLFAVILGGLLIDTDLSFFQKADRSEFEISLFLIPLSVLVTIFQLQLAGLRKFAKLGQMILLQSTSNIVLIFLFVWIFESGVNGALVAQAISLFLVACAFFYELRSRCGLVFMIPGWQQFGTVLSYGVRYYVARIGNLVDQQLGVILLAVFAAREEIGLFTAASTLALKVLMFPQSIESSMLPRVSADPEKWLGRIGQAVRISGMLTGVVMTCVVLFSFPLVLIVLSPKFLPSVPLIWILAPGIIIKGFTHILMAYFRATNRPGVISWAIWVGLCVNSFTFIALYPRLGLSAAAWAMTLGYVGQAIVVFSSYRLISGQYIREILRPGIDDLVRIRKSFTQIYSRILFLRVRHKHE